VLARYRDILESRVGKIIRLASAEAPQPPKGLQPEEAQLYEEAQRTISGWRAEMRRVGEG
jgi:DNA replication initiation complex subunit (GINS family)